MRALSIATRGRIRVGTTKNVLILATAGLLYFSAVVTPPQPPPTVLPPATSGGGKASGSYWIYKEKQDKEIEERSQEIRRRIEVEDEEIMSIIKAFLDVID